MPRNLIGNAPFAVKTLDTDTPIKREQIEALLSNSNAVSVCVRTVNGPAKRGGYFFHVERSSTKFFIRDFEGVRIDELEGEKLVRFINHASGRLFDLEMLEYCQSVINFREDQIHAE